MSFFRSIIQNVTADTTNSSTTNLAAGNSYRFTGGPSSTLGVAGIQVALKTDQNATVSVQQSSDASNWDISDAFSYFASIGNFSQTVQAVSAYTRVVVTTASLTTSYFRLQTSLCPIVEAVPRSLDTRGFFKTSINGVSDAYGFEAENTPTGEHRAVSPVRLIGTTFTGTTLDSSFWTSTLGTGGTVTLQGSQAVLSSGTTSNNNVTLQTVRTARYTGASANRFRSVIRLPDAGTVNTIRKWGAFDGSDGAYFQFSDTTAGVTTIKSGVPTVVPSGSFNGSLGGAYSYGTLVKTYEIYYTNSKVWFVIGDETLHTMSADSSVWTNNMHLPVRYECDNTNGGTTSAAMNVRVGTVSRLGELVTQSQSRYRSGQVASDVLKLGPGNLHSVILSGIVNNSVVTLYDNTAATGTAFWATGALNGAATTIPITVDFKGVPFFTGLTLAVTAANCNVLVTYE